MKFWQFFFIMAAIYVAPHVSNLVGMVMAVLWTILGFAALFRKE